MCKIKSEFQFAKEYAYNVRYMYGKEGKRVEGKPLSCPTIILGNEPAAQDCHGMNVDIKIHSFLLLGCPYRHMESEALRKKLAAMGLQEEQIEKVNFDRENIWESWH